MGKGEWERENGNGRTGEGERRARENAGLETGDTQNFFSGTHSLWGAMKGQRAEILFKV